ncbi:unnamed protein product [Meloidogyne enterolobii]|uniref:Uncharacterized protein n=1 Tax=Meloidogyne enterolobii TaxID=390850 RepID=A0ACB1ALP4_MELEN
MTRCGHFYHTDCILKWFETAKSDFDKCPTCRRAQLKIFVPSDIDKLNKKLKEVGVEFKKKINIRSKLSNAQIQLLIQLGYSIE